MEYTIRRNTKSTSLKLPLAAAFAWTMVTASLIGCSGDVASDAVVIDPAGQRYLLKSEPAGALEILKARESVKNAEEVVLVGRIGGAVDPWTPDRAAFTIVDNSFKDCSATGDDGCPTPWDYCCERDAGKTKVQVRVVDASGKLIQKDAKSLLGLKELQTVVVQGKAKRDDQGNLTVMATGIFVKKS